MVADKMNVGGEWKKLAFSFFSYCYSMENIYFAFAIAKMADAGVLSGVDSICEKDILIKSTNVRCPRTQFSFPLWNLHGIAGIFIYFLSVQ